jgi:glutathione synthase
MKPMRILFITDPLSQFKIAKDSTYAIMLEAALRGHQLFVCEVQHLAWMETQVQARVQACSLMGGDNWYRLSAPEVSALQEFDTVLMRKDPPVDIAYMTATWLLSQAEKQGSQIWNAPQALRDNSEKLAIAEFIEFAPPTLVTRTAEQIRAFHAQHRDIIIKPLDGMGGMGVFRITADGLNLNSVIETLGHDGQRNLMAQAFIPEISLGDKRILLLAGQVVPFALARIPAPGEVRGNLAVGGRGVVQPLSARDLEIAEALAPKLWQGGMLFVGLDVIGDYLTEINITSPTGLRA